MHNTIHQIPGAGTRLIKYAGDLLEIRLETASNSGHAFVRTTFASLHARRQEVIKEVEKGIPPRQSAWKDVKMEELGAGCFTVTFPLREVGVFEFKACFVSPDGKLNWVPGDNLTVKVEPAFSVSSNSIYNAFIRQFGRNIDSDKETQVEREAELLLNQNGYVVVPPTGKLSDFKDKIPHVMDTMGFRIVLFLPIHSTPVSYGRMGHYGSPFAPLDFYGVDPSLATFDKAHTPVQQFCELLDCIHARGGKAFIDIPFDHTGWASSMQSIHPEWFKRNDKGAIESPGAWGVVWEDLCKLDFSQHSLWQELANITLTWCRLGVDGFRCDAGYMIPKESWRYITAKVREEFPDTIFLLEGLGGSVDTTRELLEEGIMNWAYSESFQQFGLEAESGYLYHSLDISTRCGTLVNFAETHDNNRLAAKSPLWSVERTAGAALLAPAGAFGIANGVEWLATEKIDVHQAASLNWGASVNIIDHIKALNAILSYHPAFSAQAILKRLESLQGRAYGLLRHTGDEAVLVLVNPSSDSVEHVSWKSSEYNPGDTPYDLIKNRRISFYDNGERIIGDLPPSTVVCLSKNTIQYYRSKHVTMQNIQLAKATVLNLFALAMSEKTLQQSELEELSTLLLNNRQTCLEKIFGEYIPGVEWVPAKDCKREVMLPPSHFILVTAQHPFMVDLSLQSNHIERVYSLSGTDGTHFAVLTSANAGQGGHDSREIEIVCKLFENDLSYATEYCSKIHLLVDGDNACLPLTVAARNILPRHCGICTNQFGSYTIARAAWGTLQSKYDGLLAANPDENVPDNRLLLLARCHVWLRYRDYSCELNLTSQDSFRTSYDNTLQWTFHLSFSSQLTTHVTVQWTLDSNHNRGCMTFSITQENQPEPLFGNEEPIMLVIRPDIDWRSNHSVTKAYLGPEGSWPAKVTLCGTIGFQFAPETPSRVFTMLMPNGVFFKSPQWSYQVSLPIEQERGLETEMDLFSPGYFEVPVQNKETIQLVAQFDNGNHSPLDCFSPAILSVPTQLPLGTALRNSLDFFVVKRDTHKSIIAGYPWFLDWGRDTLICIRGLIAAGMLEEARDTILQFARFADKGTLPNMIRGNDTSDRQTSDAPLWIFAAVKDYVQASSEGNGFLSASIGGRTLLSVLESLLEAISNGDTSNGVKMDRKSGLVYSPAHYTWMDTNYPAGTPRCGYPVEIQALWLHALSFVASQGSRFEHWNDLATKVKQSFAKYYVRGAGQGLCDCLHCKDFQPASMALPDDACRPNQLLAVTLGAVTDKPTMLSILSACAALLTPAGIRSLDDAYVEYPQPIVDNGIPLNNPHYPYQGFYTGPEDTKRKPAYHNGTSWAWQMPSLCEAMYLCHGEAARKTALSLLASAIYEMNNGCIGFLPEIYDGDAPHLPKGCLAQAWSMTEFFRVWNLLQQTSC